MKKLIGYILIAFIAFCGTASVLILVSGDAEAQYSHPDRCPGWICRILGIRARTGQTKIIVSDPQGDETMRFDDNGGGATADTRTGRVMWLSPDGTDQAELRGTASNGTTIALVSVIDDGVQCSTEWNANGLTTTLGSGQADVWKGPNGELMRLNSGALVLSTDMTVTGLLSISGGANSTIDFGDPTVARPTCASGFRGYVWMDEGGAGVLDDFSICRKDAANSYAWARMNDGGSGDVVGPASSTGDAIPLFSGTSGKLIKNSTLIWNEVSNVLSTNDGGATNFGETGETSNLNGFPSQMLANGSVRWSCGSSCNYTGGPMDINDEVTISGAGNFVAAERAFLSPQITVGSAPSCGSANDGQVIYYNTTGDNVTAATCTCSENAGNTYEWKSLDGGTCP